TDVRRILLRSSSSKRTKIFWVSPDQLEEPAKDMLKWFDSEDNHIRMSSDDFFTELENSYIK
ncbi:hypothetical protein MUP59_01465, partial [Candidatus Bathyarchaeota archaeon]|nr:hypothetical protein [Candidatus Bathyarchaeota archaeon]